MVDDGPSLTDEIVGMIVIEDELLTSLPLRLAVTVNLTTPLVGPAAKLIEGPVVVFNDPRLLFTDQV
jgi:hypothetical protein